MNWKNVRVLVTAGTSFIGSDLVYRALPNGAKMRIADDLSSEGLENLAESVEGIDFRKGDPGNRDFARTGTRDAGRGTRKSASTRRRAKVASELSTCASNMALNGIVFDRT